MLNTPSRVRKGLTVLPWEVLLFKTLADSTQQIDVHQLISEYEAFMDAHGLSKVDRNIILTYLDELFTYQIGSDKISYRAYTESLKWISSNKRLNTPTPLTVQVIDKKRYNYFDWTRYGLAILTFATDSIALGLLIISKTSFPLWLIIARCGAVVILTNIAYLMIPLIGISKFIPDTILATVFPSKHSSVYHRIFGIKILVGGLVHTIAHILHIRHSIIVCADGCSRDSIHIVRRSQTQVTISYSYFFAEYAYMTGFILLGVFVMIALLLCLNRFNAIRYSMNQLLHRYLAILGILLTIVHGCSHLIGFNFSYVLTVPLLIMYAWVHRHEVIKQQVHINRWVVTPSLIRLYLNDNKRFDKMLDSFGTVTVYVNHPLISKHEWHPFTLTRGGKEATLSMQRIGVWTNKLGSLLLSQVHVNHTLRIGHYKLSKFRFHHLYRVRYFFCAGMGITGFLSAITDTTTRRCNNYTSVLVWSVSSMDIVEEFGRHLNDLKKQIYRLKIEIYYSNSKNGAVHISEQTRTRFSYLQSIIHGHSGIDIAHGAPNSVCCTFARVDFLYTFSRAIISWKNTINKDIGVFICGSRQYVTNASKYAELANANNYDVTFHVWGEAP